MEWYWWPLIIAGCFWWSWYMWRAGYQMGKMDGFADGFEDHRQLILERERQQKKSWIDYMNSRWKDEEKDG